MKTADLTGAQLDYWTARAEGVPADQLEIRNAVRPGDPRSPDQFCVHTAPAISGWMTRPQRPLDYSTNWALTGPLVEKWCTTNTARFDGVLFFVDRWEAPYIMHGAVVRTLGEGDTPLIAICRAVVRAAFGDDVEDLPCA